MAQKQTPMKTTEERSRDSWMILLFLFIGVAVAFWILYYGFHLRMYQIIAVLLAICTPIYCLIQVLRYWAELPSLMEKQWPKNRLYVSDSYVKKCMAEAVRTKSTLLGFEDSNRKPIYWTQEMRSGQSNLPGKTGSGKTTLLMNVIEQDIHQGHPLIVIEGKGDKSFVMDVRNIANAAGRGSDVRILDPSHPEISCGFNPFIAKDGKLIERVGAVFDSLSAAQAKDEFFAEHQRGYLHAVAVILGHNKKPFTFVDILLVCQDPALMGRVIEDCRARMDSDPTTTERDRWHFNLMVETLAGMWKEKDWLAKIRGLLNSFMPFVSGPLSIITGGGTDLITFEDVAEKNLILVVSLNLGADVQVQKALGRILLRNLQFMIASRYDEYKLRKQYPFLSVVLDEFGLFCYSDFKNIVHTARQANAAFIFSFQNMEQLAQDVGDAFASDMMNSPQNLFMLRMSDQSTAEHFLNASARVPKQRVSLRVEKGSVLDRKVYTEEGSGTQQEVMDTQVEDRQIKQLPMGQAMAIFPDRDTGIAVKHFHTLRPLNTAIVQLPEWVPALKRPAEDNPMLDLKSGLLVKKPVPDSTQKMRRKRNAN